MSLNRRNRYQEEDDEEDDESLNPREMTLKDIQETINKRHPFGLPIWKPALYKKSRSQNRKADRDLHSYPSPEKFINPGNILWLVMFGWWLCGILYMVSMTLWCLGGKSHSHVIRELSIYLFWPFGRYVEHQIEIRPACNAGEGTVLIPKPATYNRYSSGFGSCVYYLFFVLLIAPLLLFVSGVCWMGVCTIPMSKLTYILLQHLYKHPLSLHFKGRTSVLEMEDTMILLCTYEAVGLQYYKYTCDGINVIFINLLSVVVFAIFDNYLLKKYFPDSLITSPTVIFALSLASVIPLSYFIGMAVSSVSAQSSMGVGAVTNATFGSIIEIILYAIALVNGKSELVEGALIGSFLCGILLLPGCSMISGAFKKKEQKFNAKSAGVTTTMLIMAIIGILTPSFFYQMYGLVHMKCIECSPNDGTCYECYYDQINPQDDPIYEKSVKPLMWLCAVILPTAYFIGLVFSFHTHADMVWKSHQGDKLIKQFKNISSPSVLSELLHTTGHSSSNIHVVSIPAHTAEGSQTNAYTTIPASAYVETIKQPEEDASGEHDSPNWTKTKSFVVLFGCTLLYSIIAEILVNTVDLVMEDSPIDEKFLGLTLFALVPSITEFTNAISFALYGNIVLSMEIGSAYALQVCLVQVPAMVAFSVWYNHGKAEVARFVFT
ncbi:hypothetical protein BDB01DRAFT_796859 [Pilobolus umbonatus]|nr:hypothetical protein BDB01DRAFT_796859 [Pilobolus umbonatus]